MKYNIGFREFLLRGLEKTNYEIYLCATAYNLIRMTRLVGVKGLQEALINSTCPIKSGQEGQHLLC